MLRDAKTLAFFVRRLTKADIPEDLYRLLPRADATYIVSPPAKEHIHRLRATFLHTDDTYLYIRPSDTLSDEPLRVRHGVPQVNEEFDKTCRLLWPGAQLNLLDVAVDEAGVLTPSFLVLEPDYLIDISTLAECFKAYGHHPLNYVLMRLQPVDNARPLLLGNIVNLFLDEWIHAEAEPDYLACMKKAFRLYPIELAACADLRNAEKERQFFEDCKLHFDHLRQTVTETFHASGYGLNRRDAVLEPSYLCEALGLQGRLDYMQRDMTAFIEMKSGKAEEYAVRKKIVPKENNLVQMLLYQAVLEFSMGKDHHRVKSYLLYTRYPLLYPARASWAMLRRVMDVRNCIVAGEYAVQRHNDPAWTAEQLKSLTPDTLNERGLNNTLWKRYLAPSIEQVRRSLDALSPLEADYFYALYNFITKELYTSKSGDVAREGCTGAASLWLSTLAEKVEAGEILYDLTIRENRAADAHKPYLLLERNAQAGEAEAEAPLPNFRQGDAVVLYERNAEADNVTDKLIFKGNIEDITEREIRIRLRATQHNTDVLPAGSHYAVEHDYMDTSFRSMYRGLSAFLSATKRRRDLLLGQRPPEFDTTLDAAISSAPDDFARITLKARAARDCFLLIGEADSAPVLYQSGGGRDLQDAVSHYPCHRLHPYRQRVGVRGVLPSPSDRKCIGGLSQSSDCAVAHCRVPRVRGDGGHALFEDGAVPPEDVRRGVGGRGHTDTRAAVVGSALPAGGVGGGRHRQVHSNRRPQAVARRGPAVSCAVRGAFGAVAGHRVAQPGGLPVRATLPHVVERRDRDFGAHLRHAAPPRPYE